jgi:hypothetical protein
MRIPNYCIWLCITGLAVSQEVFDYSSGRRAGRKSKVNSSDPLKPLGMDEAYLIIRNTNYSESIMLLGNVVVCEHCDYEEVAVVPPGSTINRTISTIFAYNFKIQTLPSYKFLQCQVSSYHFSEHGTYLFEIITTSVQGQDACSITQIGEASYYWVPVIVGLLFFVGFVFFVQLWHRLRQSQYFTSLVTSGTNEKLTNNDRLPLLPTTSTRNSRQKQGTTESDDDIVNSVAPGTDLILGAAHLSNNTVHMTKVLPKRLRALDTFRGFSLMVMIFVNYGGKVADFHSTLYYSSSFFTGGGYIFFNHASMS